jgi:predicted protein tyrosine phosphatase
VIHVCGLAALPVLTTELKPTHMISLLGDDPFPGTPGSVVPDGHLKIQMHDINEPRPGFIAPEREHLESLLDFAQRWQQAGPLVIHCYAGISRSTAAALIVLCRYNQGREREAAQLLRQRAPHAYPNQRMIALADDLMGCGGRLQEAVDTMPAPDFLAPLRSVELPAHLD